MRKTLGLFDEANGGWISPSYTVNIQGIDIPELNAISVKLDTLGYINSRLTDMHQDIQQFETALSKMQFIINGKYFCATIGPDVDEYLGTESAYAARLNGIG